MKNIAIILAAGEGKRFGNELPKQYIKVKNKTILEYTLVPFQYHPKIDEIIIVCHINFRDKIKQLIKNDFPKVKNIINGGEKRHLSTQAAILHYQHLNPKDNIVIHDAARPLVNKQHITELIKELQQHDAATLTIPITDTIVQTNSQQKTIDKFVDRTLYQRVQTPQAFKYETIKEAYKQLKATDNFTDDCSIVHHYLPQKSIATVQGSFENIKITHQQDLLTFEKIISKR